MGIKIVGTGRALPERVISNHELSQTVDTSDEWIRSRTGIGQRYQCENEENEKTLAIAAAKEIILDACKKEFINKNEIGVVVVATSTAEYAFPSTACMVCSALDLDREVIAFDITAACSGFLYGLEIVRSLLAGSKKKYGLLIGSEHLTKILDMTDRTTCVLFGDGAAGALIRQDDSLYVHRAWAEGNLEALHCNGIGKEETYLHMDGKAVFKHAVKAFEQAITQVLAESEIELTDVDFFVTHQANERIIDYVRNRHKEVADKFYVNIDRYANTSAASIPIALDELFKEGKLKSGMKVLCVAFGAGFTWSGCLITV